MINAFIVIGSIANSTTASEVGNTSTTKADLSSSDVTTPVSKGNTTDTSHTHTTLLHKTDTTTSTNYSTNRALDSMSISNQSFTGKNQVTSVSAGVRGYTVALNGDTTGTNFLFSFCFVSNCSSFL